MKQSDIDAKRDRAARRRAARSLVWLIPAGAGAVILGLQQAGHIDPPTWLIWVALLSGSAALVADGVVDVVHAVERKGDAYNASDRQKFLSGCAIEIQQALGIPATSLGVSLWSVYRPRRTFGQWVAKRFGKEKQPPRRYLSRIERFRVTDPSPVDVEWPEGRGVIGTCVATNGVAYRDYRPGQRRHPEDRPMTDAKWKEVCRKDQDDGFEPHEFVRMIHRYEQVLALPIADGAGRVIGCISVDVTREEGEHEDAKHPFIKTPQVVAILHRTRELMTNTVMKFTVRP